jgi:hypothetical protein
MAGQCAGTGKCHRVLHYGSSIIWSTAPSIQLGLIPPLHVLRILPPHPGYARPEECGVQGQTEGLDAEEAGALERVAIGKNN